MSDYGHYTIRQNDNGSWSVFDPEGGLHSTYDTGFEPEILAYTLSKEPQHRCLFCNEYLAQSETASHMWWLHGVTGYHLLPVKA